MKKYIFFLCFAILLTGCLSSKMTPQKISIGDQVFLCEIASTPKERNQGLMFREQLNQNAGMLFDLEKEKETGFWMKNTLIPLDIIWIGKEKTVLGVQTAQPCLVDPCEIFQIKTPVRWVLEVNAGEFKGEVGDKVEFESEI